MRNYFKWILWSGFFAILLLLVTPESWLRRGYNMAIGRYFRHSVESRLTQSGEGAWTRLGINQLPEKVDILAFKQEKTLELWGIYADGQRCVIKSYPIIAASGTSGPKLKEGDMQVPEGIYAIEYLHPNSHFYLALKINYPSDEDKNIAIMEGRDTQNLGSAIMLHGKGGSVGCIAVENEAIEEIFYLTAKVGIEHTRILIYPYDFRSSPPPENTTPPWLHERYLQLESECQPYKR